MCYSKKKKVIIFYSDNVIDEDSRKKEIKKLGIDSLGDISGYTTRTVYTLEDLNEKLRIFSYGLNDALIEASKIWFVHNSNVNITEIRFSEVKDDFIYWAVAYDENLKGARLPMDFYRDYEKEWKVSIPDDFVLVNKDTLSKYLTRIEK